jgi:hypothetical protein
MKQLFISICLSSVILMEANAVKLVPCQFPESIKEAFKNGNSQLISENCCDNVEMSILGTEGQYAKKQTAEMLKEFFSRNVPKMFSVMFEGGKENSQYAVGKLTTNNGIYRINLLIKGKTILQIRIETYNED